MLQDAIFARDAWLKQPGNEDIAIKFLRASFQGWMFCRDNPDKCIQYTVDAGSTLRRGPPEVDDERDQPADLAVAQRHRPDAGRHLGPDGAIAKDAQASSRAIRMPRAYRTDLAEQALTGITGDIKGAQLRQGHRHGHGRGKLDRQTIRRKRESEAGPKGPASFFLDVARSVARSMVRTVKQIWRSTLIRRSRSLAVGMLLSGVLAMAWAGPASAFSIISSERSLRRFRFLAAKFVGHSRRPLRLLGAIGRQLRASSLDPGATAAGHRSRQHGAA